MLRAVVILASLFFAVWILGLSILRISAPQYAFYQPASTTQATFSANVSYDLPDPGIGPDNPFWILKALRDRVWVATTFNTAKRAQLLLLFADKRLAQAEELIRNGNVELGVATAVKAEQYLSDAQLAEVQAYNEKMETAELADILARASLKHREVLETCVSISPDDARPTLLQIIDTPKQVYEKSVQRLNEKGKIPPISNTETLQPQE